MDNSQISRAAAILGFTASIFYSGVGFSASVITLPNLYDQPKAVSSVIFSGVYYRGIPVVAPLSVIAATSAALAGYYDPSRRTAYWTAAVLSLAPMPYTAIVIAPINTQLIEVANNAVVREKTGQDVVVALLKKWKWQNMLRSAMAGLGGAIGLAAFVGEL